MSSPNFFSRKLAQRADRACRTIRHVYRVSESTWNSFFDRLTDAELRANAETVNAGVFSRDEFDFTRFRAEPFTLTRVPGGRVLEGRDRSGATSGRCANSSCGRCAWATP